MDRRLLLASVEESGGGQFYVHCDNGWDSFTVTFTIDSPKTWNECIDLKDDTGVYKIKYEMIAPEVYRFLMRMVDDMVWEMYAIEMDEDGNTPTPEDLIKIGMTYTAFVF